MLNPNHRSIKIPLTQVDGESIISFGKAFPEALTIIEPLRHHHPHVGRLQSAPDVCVQEIRRWLACGCYSFWHGGWGGQETSAPTGDHVRADLRVEGRTM